MEIANKAAIIFDVNPSIATEVFRNTLDLVAPSGVIDNHRFLNDTTVLLSWQNARDEGCGIRETILYYSVNGGPYKTYLTNHGKPSTVFIGKIDSSYSFYIVGIDSVGNAQAKPVSPNLTLKFESNGIGEFLSADNWALYPNPVSDKLYLRAYSSFSGPLNVTFRTPEGKVAFHRELYNLEEPLELDVLAKGLYIVSLEVRGRTFYYKVLKR
jgi:hypothetical protein